MVLIVLYLHDPDPLSGQLDLSFVLPLDCGVSDGPGLLDEILLAGIALGGVL